MRDGSRLLLEEQVLCLAARTDLAPWDEARLRMLLEASIDWERLWVLGHRHQVLPLIWSTLRRPRLAGSIPAAWAARAQRGYHDQVIRNAARADELVRVLDGFSTAGVEAMPVNGIAVAETVDGDLAMRVLGDLDVLVRGEDVSAARATLDALGYATRPVPLFSKADHPFHDLQYFRRNGGDEVCLELHWALWSPHFFRGGVDGLWERSVRARVHGRDASLLSPEDTLLHLAIRRTSAPLRLRFLCDIAELVRLHGDALDWPGLASRARAYGARTALFMALWLARELLGAPVPDAALETSNVGSLKRRMLDRTCGVTGLFRRVADGDLKQQPRLVFRVLEHDGLAQIIRSATRRMAPKPARWRYHRHATQMGPV